ncbi:F-box/FBD/LRR-repeat protein At1g16930-like isoform X2 [Carex rostrata]
MDPTESCTKRRRKIAVADVDRISQLPEDLQILILSLLSTEEAVQTSLLSKRFQNLWTKVPVLDFNFDEFRPDDYTFDELDDPDRQNLLEFHEEKFKKIICGVFQHRNQSINLDSFKLKWVEEESDLEPVSALLHNVAKMNPKFLSVHIYSDTYHYEVPDSIYSCKSLQEMELNLGLDVIPRSVNLPCLKKLTLHKTVIKDEVMQKLSRLSALEELVLFDCELNTCDISSGTLKRLVLDSNDNYVNETDITISTPHLLYLEVLCCAKGTIKLNKMDSLVKACIHYLENKNSLFLTALSNASDLELMLSKSGVLEMKDVLKEETTEFPNLKTLKIGEWCMTDQFDVVDRFLSNARNLQKLTLLHLHQEYV